MVMFLPCTPPEQCPCVRMSCIYRPAKFTLEDEADLKECAVNILVSIPAKPKTVVSHLATAAFDTVLYGYIKLKKTFVVFGLSTQVFVRFMHAFIVATGHSFFFGRKSFSLTYGSTCLDESL